ncbi:MAG: thioesterase family protein [Verrucomicrobiia bacterium]
MSEEGAGAEVELALSVYFYDTDAAGVVHNLAYLRMVEAARTDLAEKLGWRMTDMIGGSEGCPVVARTEIDYVRPARLGERLVVRSRLETVERVRFTVRTRVERAEDGVLFCEALQTLVTVDLKTGRPRPLREDWRARWGGGK